MSDFNAEQNSRRKFLGITSKAGFSTLVGSAAGINLGIFDLVHAQSGGQVQPFRFAHLTDSHLFSGVDHKFDRQLEDAVDQINQMTIKPDFVVYGGDIAQNGTEDQLVKGKQILSKLQAKLIVIPGEHDWYVDMGKAWTGLYGTDGKAYWSFNNKGVHFIGMNSILVKDFWTAKQMSPRERMAAMEMLEGPIGGLWGVGSEQLDWLKKDVANLPANTPVVVFTHSPLWDYYPRWNFQTVDAPQIREILGKFANVTSIHGHVHQTVYNKIGNMTSVGAMSTSWPWPYPPVALQYPGSQQYRADPGNEEDGMGTLAIDVKGAGADNKSVIYQPFANTLTPFLQNLKV
jgi:3',5'-cyclic AMP phosphodiesterase CpdA